MVYHVVETLETGMAGKRVSCCGEQERVSLLLLLLPKYTVPLLATTTDLDLMESTVDQLEENK